MVGGDIMSGGKFGYMDKSGNMIIKPQFVPPFVVGPRSLEPYETAYGGRFSEGLAADIAAGEGEPPGNWGYIDKTGKMVIELKDKHLYPAGPFTEGLAPVVEVGPDGFVPIIANGVRVGYIDKSGQVVIPPQFGWAEADYLSADLWRSWVSRSKGPMAFSGGLAAVASFPEWGYIDKTGKLVWQPPQ